MRALLLLAALTPAAAEPARRPEVRADARVELAAALHLAALKSGPLPGWADDGSPYAKALSAIASARASHPAVDAYRRTVSRPAVSGGAFMNALQDLTRCLDDALAPRGGEECGASPLAGPAATFAAETSFRARWEKEARPLLDAEVAALSAQRDRADLVSLFEQYVGTRAPCSYVVAPSPLLAKGLFWNGLVEGSPCLVTTVLSPASAKPGARFDWVPVMRDVWHEEGHALLDALATKEPKADALARPGLSGRALEDCYGSWEQCVREHAAQGLSAAILDWADRGRRLPFLAEPHLKPTLPLLAKVMGRLREYEGDRKRWPDLPSFYPRLVAVLEGPAGAAVSTRVHGREASKGGADRDAGVSAFGAGKASEAAALLEKAVTADPKLADAWLSLSVVEVSRGRASQARAAADRAVALGRTDGELPPGFLSDALSTRAGLRAAAGDAEGARADRAEALGAAPLGWPRAAEVRAALGAEAP